jgi:hypothetical protein
MGHLLFAGLLVFMIILLVGKIYFSYIYASRRNQDNDTATTIGPDTDEQDKLFYIKTGIKVLSVVFALLDMLLLLHLTKLFKEMPEKSDGLWMLFDLAMIALFVFITLFAECLRSYIHIYRDGFEYRGIFRAKAYSKNEIESVCRTTEFIFIKRKGHKMPIIVEAVYNGNDFIYRMLRNLEKKPE